MLEGVERVGDCGVFPVGSLRYGLGAGGLDGVGHHFHGDERVERAGSAHGISLAHRPG